MLATLELIYMIVSHTESTYIDISIEYYEQHVNEEIPCKGDQGRVLINAEVSRGGSFLALTDPEYPESSQIPCLLAAEEPYDNVDEDQVHGHGHDNVLYPTIEETEEAILPIVRLRIKVLPIDQLDVGEDVG